MTGGIWSWFMPFNKNLWSSSFTLYTAGLAALILGAMIWLIDSERKCSRLSRPFQIFGSNAIAAYILHSLCGRPFFATFGSEGNSWSINEVFMNSLIKIGIPPNLVSLLWALAYTTLIFCIVHQLHRRKWFLRI
jgi:predicted acyltransferase